MKTTTTTGIEVTLTAKLGYLDRPTVHASFAHPKAGQVEVDLQGYGKIQGKDAAYGDFRGQTVALMIPQADYDAVQAGADSIIETAIGAIRSGATRIELRWSEGSPLSGYVTVTKFASQLLRDLKIARDISGWGCLVDEKAAKALGESFTYAEAVAYTQPARELEDAAVAMAAAHRAEKIAEAAAKGSPVELRAWTEPCTSRTEECGLDVCVETIDAQGRTAVRRSHTW